jgi:hypothetical protein
MVICSGAEQVDLGVRRAGCWPIVARTAQLMACHARYPWFGYWAPLDRLL